MNGNVRAGILALSAAAAWSLAPSRALASDLEAMTESHIVQLGPYSRAVRFEQVSFDFEAGRLVGSDWGQFLVHPAALVGRTGWRSAYVNVFLQSGSTHGPGWVVENLHVLAPSDGGCTRCPTPGPHPPTAIAFPMSVYFDLRPGLEASGQEAEVLATVLASRQPLPIVEDVLRLADRFQPKSFPVVQVVHNTEGEFDQRVPLSLPPGSDLVGPPPQATIPPAQPAKLAFPIGVFQASTPNVHAAKNQCVPMAHANNLQYLEDRYNAVPLVWSLPHAPIPGIGMKTAAGDVIAWIPVPTHSLVANVDALTRREGVFSPGTGQGSDRCQNIRGLLGYVTVAGATVQGEFRHQGGAAVYGDGAACDDNDPTLPLGGNVSVREGAAPTWQWIFDQLSLGRGVVLSYNRYDSNGNLSGGHMLRVWGAERVNNTDYLYTLDDAVQNDNTQGLRTSQWEVADSGSPGQPGVPDGRLNIDGGSAEIGFALSVEAKPTLMIP
jgi:hypothetical protein